MLDIEVIGYFNIIASNESFVVDIGRQNSAGEVFEA